MTSRLLTTGILAALLYGSALALGVTFLPAPTVSGAHILLGDVATLEGTDDEVARLRAIDLGAAPIPGQTRELTQSMIRVRLRQAGLDPEALTLAGPEQIRVSRLATEVTGDSLAAIARQWLAERCTAPEGEELALTCLRAPGDLKLPDGELAWECSAVGADTGSMRSVLLLVRIDKTPAWRGLLSFKVERFANVLATTGLIQRGKPIDPAQVISARKEISNLTGTPLTSVDQLAGMQATQSLNPGAVLTTATMEPIPLIRRRDQVKVIARCGNLIITTLGIAGEDGAAGAIIKVRNPQTQQDFTVRVLETGEGELVL